MKKKKGLTLEEKRQTLLKLFKGSGSFYHYKDIEKHCTQNKISFMIVKDLLGGIVADNLLETEKIGSSAFYWYLPNRVYDAKKKQIKKLKYKIKNEKKERFIFRRQASNPIKFIQRQWEFLPPQRHRKALHQEQNKFHDSKGSFRRNNRR